MGALRAWFEALGRREQRTVLFGGVAVVIVLLFGALLPFERRVNTAQQRVAAKQSDLAWLQSMGPQIAQLQSAAPIASHESMVVLVDRIARETGDLGRCHRDRGSRNDDLAGIERQLGENAERIEERQAKDDAQHQNNADRQRDAQQAYAPAVARSSLECLAVLLPDAAADRILPIIHGQNRCQNIPTTVGIAVESHKGQRPNITDLN